MNPTGGRTCRDCRWCLLEDYGYSNWTVEGTQVFCLRDAHPSGPKGFDAWYGEDERLLFAAGCQSFQEGEAALIDVDRENGPPWSRHPEVEIILQQRLSVAEADSEAEYPEQR